MPPLTVLHLRNPDTGQPYRKTLQYGFDLQQAVDARCARPGRWHDTEPRWHKLQHMADIREDLYACGFLPARYPLLARNPS